MFKRLYECREWITFFFDFDFVELRFSPVLRLPLALKGAKNRVRLACELDAVKIKLTQLASYQQGDVGNTNIRISDHQLDDNRNSGKAVWLSFGKNIFHRDN